MTSEEIRMMGKTVMDDGSVKDGINGEWNSDLLRELTAQLAQLNEGLASLTHPGGAQFNINASF